MAPTAAHRPQACHRGLSEPVVDSAFFTIMLLLFLEALGALCLFVFIVWWTMFSGRKGGELPDAHKANDTPPEDPPNPP